MTIRPESYGRSKEGTNFAKQSKAEQYETDKVRLFKQLEKPLSNYLTSKVDRKGLNMFDENQQISFSKTKLNAFRAKDIKNIDDKTMQKARLLGARNIGAERNMETLKSIGDVKRASSDKYKSKFAQDLKFIT